MPEISNHLEQIFNNSFSISYYSVYFKESIIIIFHIEKNNRNFTNLKNYRPISLFNIVEKIMEIVLAVRINHIATTHNLLFKIYFRD